MNEDKFTGKANIYAKYRPNYPSAFLDYLYKDVGFNAQSVVADIGAGTGILSKQLLQRRSNVICVEPNDDMLGMATQELADFQNVQFVQASAENTGLRGHCVDFITVAQAFHWFDRKAFKAECQRILRSTTDGSANGDKVVLVWNDKDLDSPLMQEIAEVNARYRENFEGFSGGREINPDAYADFFRNGHCEYKTFRNDRMQSEETLIGGCLSASDAPKEGSPNHQGFVSALRQIFKKHSENGLMALPQVTRSYVGRV